MTSKLTLAKVGTESGEGDDEVDPKCSKKRRGRGGGKKGDKHPQKVVKNNRAMKKVDRQTGASDADVRAPPAKKQKIFGSQNRLSSEDDEEGHTDNDNEVYGEGIDETPGSSKGRKNIRKLIKVKDLHVTTQEAASEEEARKQRLAERQKLCNQLFKPLESGKLDSLVLDFNTDIKEAVVSVHPAIVAQLKPHQADGIKFMWNNCFESLEAKKEGGGCILAHCMGLGKTLQSVALVHTLITHPKTGVRTVLVICPLTTAENWCDEFRKWTKKASGKVRVHRLWEKKGNERFKSLQLWHKHGGVGILHYERFRTLINSFNSDQKKKGQVEVERKFLQIIKETLLDSGPDLVICDEGHVLKNVDSKISKTVNKIKTRRRIILTGTPMQNNLTEYHAMMSFIKPHLLGDIAEFRNRFVNPISNGQHKHSSDYGVGLMKKRAHVLHKLLEGCVQRLDYKVLTPFLPPKYEYAICINLTEEQKDLYEHYTNNLSAQSKRSGFEGGKFFADYTILNKICAHPKLLAFEVQKDSRGEEASSASNVDDAEPMTPAGLSSSDASDDEDEQIQKPATDKEPKSGTSATADGEDQDE